MPTVYDFKVISVNTGQVHRRGPATPEGIQRAGGEIDPSSGIDVSDADIDGNGFLKPFLSVAFKLPDQRVSQILQAGLAAAGYPASHTNGAMSINAFRELCITLEAALRDAGASAGDIGYARRMLKYAAERAPELRSKPDVVTQIHRAIDYGLDLDPSLAIDSAFLGRVRIKRLNRTDIGPEDAREATTSPANAHLRRCPDCGSDRTFDERRSRSAGAVPQSSPWMRLWTCDACGSQAEDRPTPQF